MSFFGGFFNSRIASAVHTSSNQVNGLANNIGIDNALFKAVFSEAWETLDQNFYTRLSQTVEPIDSTLIFLGNLLSSGCVKAYDAKGNEVENDLLVRLLNNPNQNQDFKDFTKAWLYYLLAHGWEYIIPSSKSLGFESKLTENSQLFAPDPDLIKWNSTNWLYSFFANNNTLSFNYEPYGLEKIKYENVIPYFDIRQNTKKPHMGISRLLALKPIIQNYHTAIQAKGNMLYRSGAQVVSPDVKGDDMALDAQIGTGQIDEDGNPVMTTHKEKFENQLASSGLGGNNKSVVFSTIPVKVTQLSEGLEKLDYDKYSSQDARVILNKFDIPKEFQNLVLSDVAKYDEKNSSLKFLYQNIIQPLADSLVGKLVKYYNHPNKVVIDYSHLPVFADTEETKLDRQQKAFTLYQSLLEKNHITQEDFNQIMTEYGIL